MHVDLIRDESVYQMATWRQVFKEVITLETEDFRVLIPLITSSELNAISTRESRKSQEPARVH